MHRVKVFKKREKNGYSREEDKEMATKKFEVGLVSWAAYASYANSQRLLQNLQKKYHFWIRRHRKNYVNRGIDM